MFLLALNLYTIVYSFSVAQKKEKTRKKKKVKTEKKKKAIQAPADKAALSSLCVVRLDGWWVN